MKIGIQGGVIVLVSVLVFALSVGGTLHAVIPHEHDENGKGVSSIWQTLHMALRHEDKKTFLAVADAFVIPSTDLDVSAEALIIVALILYARQRPFNALLNSLRRGIVPYRKFG